MIKILRKVAIFLLAVAIGIKIGVVFG